MSNHYNQIAAILEGSVLYQWYAPVYIITAIVLQDVGIAIVKRATPIVKDN